MEAWRTEVAERFEKTKGIEQSAGFVRMEVMLTEGLADYDELKVSTTWESKASFDNWVNSDSFRLAHAHRGNKQADVDKEKEGEGERMMLGSQLTIHRILVSKEAAAIS